MALDTTNGPVTERKQSIERRRLLVVGEDLGDLAARHAFLQTSGYQVVGCSSPEQAARSLQSKGFYLVLLHQCGREFDWRGVLEHAIAIDRHRPVLVVTRCIDMPSYLDAMQLGAIDYVEEPLRPSELIQLIEVHLPPREGHD